MSDIKYATEHIDYIGLPSVADDDIFKVNPTIAAGDFQVSTDGGSYSNLDTLPTLSPASSDNVKITLSVAETTGSAVKLRCLDASGTEWKSVMKTYHTELNTNDDIAESLGKLSVGAGGISVVAESATITTGTQTTDNIDNAAAVDDTGGLVGIPITGHPFSTGDVVFFAGTTNYEGTFTIVSETTNEIVITATYQAENFAGSETVTITYTSTHEFDGATHAIAADGGVIEMYYQFDVGVTGVATEIIWSAYCQTNGDTVTIKAFNWTSSAFEQISPNITCSNGTSITEHTFIVTNSMTGTAANVGKVRFQITSTTATGVFTDRVLCEFTALPEAGSVLHSGVLDSATATTVVLDSSASSTDDFYNNARIVISSGTGSEQERLIVDYTGSTKTAKIAPRWVTTPDNTSAFEIEPALSHAETGWATIETGTATAGGNTTITLDGDASGINNFYNADVVHIEAGTGAGQSRVITGYDGSTKIATVSRAWTTNPDSTSEYDIENGITVAEVLGTTAVAQINAEIVPEILNTNQLIESQRGTHTVTGDIYYWDPENGNDSNDGLTKATARATFQSIHDNLVTDNNHDVIMAIAGNASGATVTTEKFTISKNYTFLRGPGRDFKIIADASGDVVTITGTGVEVSGVVVQTHTAGTGIAINVNGGDFANIHNVWVEFSRSHGIQLKDTSYSIVKDVIIFNAGDTSGHGIMLDGSGVVTTQHNLIHDVSIHDCGNDGVHLKGAMCEHNSVYGGNAGTHIYNNGGWGIIDNGTAVSSHVLGPNLAAHDNTSGDISLTATGSIQENDVANKIKKNTVLAGFPFQMTDSTTHLPKTGLTVTATRSLDGGAFGAAANSVSEISGGWYKIDLAATDTNADTIALNLTAPGADLTPLTIVTQP